MRPQLKGEILSPEPPGKFQSFPVLFHFSAHNTQPLMVVSRPHAGWWQHVRFVQPLFCLVDAWSAAQPFIPFEGACRDDCIQLAISLQLLTYELLSVALSSPELAQLCLWPAESELRHIGPRLSHHSAQSLTHLGCDECLQVNYPLTSPKGPWSRSSACATGEGEKTKA